VQLTSYLIFNIKGAGLDFITFAKYNHQLNLTQSPILEVSPALTSPVLVEAREYVLSLYNKQTLGQKLVFHNLKSTIQLVNYCSEIGRGEGVVDDSIALAAWFSFTGYLNAYNQPLDESVNHLIAFGETKNIDSKTLDSAKVILGTYYNEKGSGNRVEGVFKDAVKVLLYGPEFKIAQNLLQYEIELNGGEALDKLELQNQLLTGLLNAQLITPYAIEKYGQILGQNILSTRKQVKKLDPESGLKPIAETFSQIEEGVPNRGIQSYFRSIYRVHINLSAIADNKANIMISVNAILISVLISLLSYKNISETNPTVMVPVLVFIVAGLASLIFAVLSARPKITYPNKGITDRNLLKRNAIFFGSFVTMELDEYEDVMDEIFRDGTLIYGNMIRDMYYLGQVLDKKYQYLIISYNIFMVGFAITVISFLAILFVF